VGERFGLKNGGGGTAFPHTLTTGCCEEDQ